MYIDISYNIKQYYCRNIKLTNLYEKPFDKMPKIVDKLLRYNNDIRIVMVIGYSQVPYPGGFKTDTIPLSEYLGCD